MNGHEIDKIEDIFKKEIKCINTSIGELKKDVKNVNDATLINTVHLINLNKLPDKVEKNGKKISKQGGQLLMLISIVILLMGGLSTIAWYVAQIK